MLDRVGVQFVVPGLVAIVASITRVHSGSLSIVPRPAGDLRVAVQLPAAGARPPTAPGPAVPDALSGQPGVLLGGGTGEGSMFWLRWKRFVGS